MLRSCLYERLRRYLQSAYPPRLKAGTGRTCLSSSPFCPEDVSPSSLRTLLSRQRARFVHAIPFAPIHSRSPNARIPYWLHLIDISHIGRRPTQRDCYYRGPASGFESAATMGLSDVRRRVTQTLRKRKSRKFKDGVSLSSRDSESDVPPVPPVPSLPKDQKTSKNGKGDDVVETIESAKSNEGQVVTDSSHETEVEEKQDPNSLSAYHHELFEHHASSQERIVSVGSADYPVCPPISKKEAQRPRSMDIPERQSSEPLRLTKKAAVRPISADNSTIPPVPRIPDKYSKSRSPSRKSDLAAHYPLPPMPKERPDGPDPLQSPDFEDLLLESIPCYESNELTRSGLNVTHEDIEALVSAGARRAQVRKSKTSPSRQDASEDSRRHASLVSLERTSNINNVADKEAEKHLPHSETMTAAIDSTTESSMREGKDRLKSRSASTQTTISKNSDSTVNHDPSKRCSSALAAGVESRFLENFIPNPFADENEVESSREASINRDDTRVQHGTRQRSHNTKQQRPPAVENIKPTPRPEICDSHDEGHGVAPFFAQSSEQTSQTTRSRANSVGSSRSSSCLSRRLLESDQPEKRARKRSKALLSYNASAQVFGLNVLRPDEIPQSGMCRPPENIAIKILMPGNST